jgi:N-methylhydantoinase A/oxoprolinase/acetone carboxylase beta subunit
MTESPCQFVPGAVVEAALGRLVIDLVKPSALEITVAVQDELHKRFEETDRQCSRHVERAQYEADLARRRTMNVDPNNRMVAGTLEADWNDKLRVVEEVRREYEEQRKADHLVLDENARRKIANLAVELPAIWDDPRTPIKARKRMLAYLIETSLCSNRSGLRRTCVFGVGQHVRLISLCRSTLGKGARQIPRPFSLLIIS